LPPDVAENNNAYFRMISAAAKAAAAAPAPAPANPPAAVQ
jgi:hypothetical protein